MISTVPSLTLDGFITNKNIIVAKLWSYYLTSDHSQSTTFRGLVQSLKYDLLSSDIDHMLSKNIEKSLEELYGNYFDKAKADVIVKTDKGTNTQYASISLTLTDIDDKNNSKKYYLSKEIESTNGEIKNFEKLLDELYEEYNNQNN